MCCNEINCFQFFFNEGKYIALKNYLYNYLLRKRSIGKNLQHENPELILEVGSGISPVMTLTDRIIYSDLSLSALRILKQNHKKGLYVVADSMCLPFKTGVFSHTISSEVLEHLEDDREALKELARVMKPLGQLIVTFPHRKFYFSHDDRFVNHYRRYEIHEMEERLISADLRPYYVQKVLGPIDKIIMNVVIYSFMIFKKYPHRKTNETKGSQFSKPFVSVFKWANRFFMVLAMLDNWIMPRALSTVILIKAEKSDK